MADEKITWTRDDGYSGERTARRGDFAAVIIPPNSAYNDADAWEIQVFDEEAEEYWETVTRVEGIPGKKAAKKVAAALLEELAAARK